jgi:hypothetical protein
LECDHIISMVLYSIMLITKTCHIFTILEAYKIV